MTGLKSGSGDDLWGDDDTDDSSDSAGSDADTDATSDTDVADDRTPDPEPQPTERTDSEPDADAGPDDAVSGDDLDTESSPAATDDSGPTLEAPTAISQSPSDSQPYIVRRAVQDKSVQFERDERLTFFVHDDVADGERDLITDLESALGRDVPKFDVREAVYRAALQNPDDVLAELLKMGYSVDEE